jgi:hypothetical protein
LLSIQEPELAIIEEHLLWCHECLDRAEENLRSFRENGREHLGHISTENLERYHLGHLELAQVVKINEHTSGCREYADRMTAVKRFILLVRAGVIRGGFDKGIE